MPEEIIFYIHKTEVYKSLRVSSFCPVGYRIYIYKCKYSCI